MKKRTLFLLVLIGLASSVQPTFCMKAKAKKYLKECYEEYGKERVDSAKDKFWGFVEYTKDGWKWAKSFVVSKPKKELLEEGDKKQKLPENSKEQKTIRQAIFHINGQNVIEAVKNGENVKDLDLLLTQSYEDILENQNQKRK